MNNASTTTGNGDRAVALSLYITAIKQEAAHMRRLCEKRIAAGLELRGVYVCWVNLAERMQGYNRELLWEAFVAASLEGAL
jgi:hypothetical protein